MAVSVILTTTILLRMTALAVSVAVLRRLRQWKFDCFIASSLLLGMFAVGRTLFGKIPRLIDEIRVNGFQPRLEREELPSLIGGIAVLLVILVVHRLLRQRQASEEQLRRSEQRWQQLVDAAPMGVFVSEGAEARTVYANRELTTMLGRSSNEIREDHWLDPVVEEDRHQIRSAFKQVASDAPKSLEFRFHSPENELRWSHLSLARIHNVSDAQARWVGMVSDITDQKKAQATLVEHQSVLEKLVKERTAELAAANHSLRAEVAARRVAQESLRESNSMLHTLMHHVPDLVMTVDRAGTLLFVNHHQRPCFPEIKAGKSFLEYVPERYHTWYRRALENAFQHAAGDELADLAMEARSWRIRIVPIQENEDISSCMLICTETTSRKKAEEGLRLRDAELAHVSRVATAGEMVSGIAHEIAQPLAAISNYSSALRHTYEGNHLAEPKQVRKWNRKIGEQAARAAAIIDGLRGFVANVPSRFSVVDLHGLVREAVQLVQITHRNEDIAIQLILSAESSMVLINPIEITQVIVNLVRNACDALALVSYDDRRVILSTTVDGKNLVLDVTDNGPGMTDQVALRIYDPFFTTKSKGMGMGLAICRTILARHHGHLSHIITAPHGTTFSVTLPLAKKDSES